MAKHRRRNVKKSVVAGAAVATVVGMGAVASPGMSAAVEQATTMAQAREMYAQIELMAASNTVDPVKAAEIENATFGNVMVIADSLGRFRGVMINPLAKLAPSGWLPTTTSTYEGPTSTPLTYSAGLARSVAMMLEQPNTSGVPGVPMLSPLATLLPSIEQGLPLLPIGVDGGTAVARALGAIGILEGVNLAIEGLNLRPFVDGVYKPGPISPLITGIPSLDVAIPGATETTSSWFNNFNWELFQTSGSTWMKSDQLVMPNVTTEAIKDNFDLNVPGPLTHQNPVWEWVTHTGEPRETFAYFYPAIPPRPETACTAGTIQCGLQGASFKRGGPNNTWGWWFPATAGEDQRPCTLGDLLCSNTQGIIKVSTGWTTDTWQTYDHVGWGNPVIDLDPQATGVTPALNLLNGINVPGYSITKKEVGGDYNFIGGGQFGWLNSSTVVVIPELRDADGKLIAPAQVSTVPTTAAGIALPAGLLTVGGLYTPGVVTQSGQTTNSVLGSRSFGWSVPLLGMGIDTTSVFESSRIGPDGIAFNSGQTVALLNGGPVPIPLVYSLGSFNMGPKGIGFNGPSLFGVGLPGFQLGDNVGSTSAPGGMLGNIQLPNSLITLDPKMLFSALNIKDPTGLGLDDPIGTVTKVLDPVYRELVTPLATPLWKAAADLNGQLSNASLDLKPQVTEQLGDLAGELAEAAEHVSGQIDPNIPNLSQSNVVKGLQQRLGLEKALSEASNSMANAGDDLKKASTRAQKSLGKTQVKLNAVADAVKEGNPTKIAKAAGDAAKDTLTRVKKEVDRAVKKVTKAVKGE